jgi:hypothetical protein
MQESSSDPFEDIVVSLRSVDDPSMRVVLGTVEEPEDDQFALPVVVPEVPPGRYVVEAAVEHPYPQVFTDRLRIIERP